MNGTGTAGRAQALGGDAADACDAVRPAPWPADFAAIFAAYGSYVLVLLRRLGVGASDVEDVAQEVFLAVHRGLDRFEGRSSLKTWVSGICVHAASNHRRKAHRRREYASAELECSVDASQLARVEDRELALRLQRALLGLSEKQREVFVLYEIEQLTMSEVAKLVGCTRFTAYTRLRAARRAMRERFAAETERERERERI